MPTWTLAKMSCSSTHEFCWMYTRYTSGELGDVRTVKGRRGSAEGAGGGRGVRARRVRSLPIRRPRALVERARDARRDRAGRR